MQTRTGEIGFAICVAAGSEDDLEVGKVYRMLRDARAAEVGCLQVIDESRQDSLYPANRFVIVDVPEPARGWLLKAVKGESA